MKKFYTFTAGRPVPSWMMGFDCDEVDMHQNKHGRIVFGCSVVAVRETGRRTKLIPAAGGECYVCIRNFKNACIGGVSGASGVHLRCDHPLSGFGEGLVYTV
ncbi:hypothetical protein NVP1024O_03 [Vibrio phage 1.024.O._10N.261.45.F8]|nr:hypothetical protein NVP1024O_03 [Vibrio phage 1.024.O._10N.261.45.F8]